MIHMVNRKLYVLKPRTIPFNGISTDVNNNLKIWHII